MMKQYNTVLTIAGSDSGGGAGIQADMKTISACGCFATSAITAITVQNTLGVHGVHPLPTQLIADQIDTVLSDIGANAIKIGMLHSSEVMNAVKESISKHNIKNIVLDPVMVSTSGHRLMEESATKSLIQDLIPIARIITPNIPEAEIILGKTITDQDQLPALAKELSFNRKVSVMLKAGHLKDDTLTDIFYNAETDETIELSSKRVYSKNTHGTGCTFSSAIASFLAKGLDMNSAVREAKNYLANAIISGSEYKIGNGFGPVDHFYKQ